MGTWGTSITSDDEVQDVHDEYINLFNRRLSPSAIVKQVLEWNAEDVDDSDSGPLVWIAIAKAQWDCGQLQPKVLQQVRTIVRKGLGLDRWAEGGPKLLAARKKVLDSFLLEIQTPKLKPRKPKKATKRKPIFQPGDCVAMRLPGGDWGAVLILHRPPESVDPFEDTYGFNLAVVMDYRGAKPPDLNVFETRQWYRTKLHARSTKAEVQAWDVMSIRFRSVKDSFRVIGNIALRDKETVETNQILFWDQMLQEAPTKRRTPTGSAKRKSK